MFLEAADLYLQTFYVHLLKNIFSEYTEEIMGFSSILLNSRLLSFLCFLIANFGLPVYKSQTIIFLCLCQREERCAVRLRLKRKSFELSSESG